MTWSSSLRKQTDNKGEDLYRMVKLFDFIKTFQSKILNTFRNFNTFRFICECRSKLNHNFSLFFFYYKKWKQKRQKRIQQSSSGKPFYLVFPLYVLFFSTFFVYKTTKFFMNPIHKFLIGINNLESRKITIMSFGGNSSLDINRAFPINYSSQICNFFFCPHAESFFSYFNRNGNVCHAERLNSWDWFTGIGKPICDSLNFAEMQRGRSEEIFPPWQLRSKK